MAAKKARSKSRAADLSEAQLIELAVEHGALAAKVVSPAGVHTAEWVRWKCQFGCGGFGSSLVCPPHTPTPEQTRRMLDGYQRAILFEAPPAWPRTKEIAVALERELFLSGCYKALALGSGPCSLCRTCAFEKGCRHPRKARPSMEACGIDVYATARGHGFTIEVVRTRKDPQHYYGLVMVD